jgi:MFS family permease
VTEAGAVLPGAIPDSGPAREHERSDEDAARPTAALPLRQLLQISLYWLGINAIMGGINVAVVERVSAWFPADKGFYLALQGFAILWVNILVQPTVGMISDYTVSRWGRRKPYIAIGASLDVLFVIGLATANSYIVLVAFLVLLQFSSNFAQGPFQGYVPDLVPEKQVGLASAMVGAMQTVGFVVGGIVVSVSYILPKGPDGHTGFTVPTIVLGFIELATAIGTVLWVREGGRPRDRRGRSWVQIARSAWALEILNERSFVFLVLSRLMFFAGVNALLGWFLVFFNQTLHIADSDKALLVPLTNVVVALVTVAATFPAARISDRAGRKPVIYAACAVGAIALAVVGLAPTYAVFLVGAMLLGVASGTFLAVDWALMTDIIPKAASGRYMGISNIAVAAAGTLAAWVVGPLIDVVGQHDLQLPEGPRVAELVAIGFFVLSAVFLRRVDPRRRVSAVSSPS